MKAEILEQQVCADSLGFVHSMFYKIRRLWIKSVGVLITTEDDKIYVHNKPFGEFKKVGEIEIKDKLVEDAVALLQAKTKMNKHLKAIKELTEKEK